MNDLFEAFIGRSLKRAFEPHRVRLQARGEFALKDEANDEWLFALRPDAIVEKPGCIVLDTKWKALEPARLDLGVAPDDIYQMLAYCRAYRADRAILLYPWHKEIDHAEGVIKRWKAKEADPFSVHVAAVDVGRPKDVPDILRNVVNDVSNGAEYRRGRMPDAP